MLIRGCLNIESAIWWIFSNCWKSLPTEVLALRNHLCVHRMVFSMRRYIILHDFHILWHIVCTHGGVSCIYHHECSQYPSLHWFRRTNRKLRRNDRWLLRMAVEYKQDCFLQKEARVCVSNALVIEDSKFKWCFLLWKMSMWQRKQIC